MKEKFIHFIYKNHLNIKYEILKRIIVIIFSNREKAIMRLHTLNTYINFIIKLIK